MPQDQVKVQTFRRSFVWVSHRIKTHTHSDFFPSAFLALVRTRDRLQRMGFRKGVLHDSAFHTSFSMSLLFVTTQIAMVME